MIRNCLILLLLASVSLSVIRTVRHLEPEQLVSKNQQPAVQTPISAVHEKKLNTQSPATTKKISAPKNVAVPELPIKQNCAQGTHWMWTNLTTGMGMCVQNDIKNCLNYESVHGNCVQCNNSFDLEDDNGKVKCTSSYSKDIILAALIILLLVIVLIVAKKFRESREAPADYYDAAKVYATPLKLPDSRMSEIKEKD